MTGLLFANYTPFMPVKRLWFVVAILLLALLLDVAFFRGHSTATVVYSPPEQDRSAYSGGDGVGGVFFDNGSLPVTRTISGHLTANSLAYATLGGFSVSVDDCLTALSINDQKIADVSLPYCNWHSPLMIKSMPAPILVDGSHLWSFTASFMNSGGTGRFSLQAVQATWLTLFKIGVYTALLSLVLWHVCQPISCGFTAALIVGTTLRVIYYFLSDFNERAHDLQGHLDYLDFFLKNWRVPNPLEGWEFHQSPTFYGLVAALIALARTITGADVTIVEGALTVTLVCSLATLVFILRAVQLASEETRTERTTGHYPDQGKDKPISSLLTAVMLIVATNPNLIFSTMRISNDPLVFSAVSYVAYRCILQMRTAQPASHTVVLLSSSLALLAKTNGMVAFVLWFIADTLTGSFKWVIKRGVILALCLTLVGGSYFSFRYQQSKIMGVYFRQDSNLNSRLSVPSDLNNFLIINPGRIIADVYNDTWSDSRHREFFWEFLVKSFVFGEVDHGKELIGLGRVMLLCTLLLVGLVALSLLPQVCAPTPTRTYAALGLLSSLFTLILFRLKYPFSCCQDARLIPAIYPMAAVLLSSACTAQRHWSFLQYSLQYILYALPLAQIVFILSVVS